MCLILPFFFHHNAIDKNVDPDLIPSRPIFDPTILGEKAIIIAPTFVHNIVEGEIVEEIDPEPVNPTDGAVDLERHRGPLIKLFEDKRAKQFSEKEQMRIFAEGQAKRGYELAINKQKLHVAKIKFQKSMDELNEQLVLVRKDV
ncbi:unnamed protein product [Sphagnum balticum]